jgi:hypothetical protein
MYGVTVAELSLIQNTNVVIVRYHDDGSKKLNACIRLLLHMVYL